MRILVTGWRRATLANHGAHITRALGAVCGLLGIQPGWPEHGADRHVLVHGDCSGADHLCRDVALRWGWAVEAHPAVGHPHMNFGPWPQAGPRRNRYMVMTGANAALALPGPGSIGTWRCLQMAGNAGIRTLIWPLPGGRTEGPHE